MLNTNENNENDNRLNNLDDDLIMFTSPKMGLNTALTEINNKNKDRKGLNQITRNMLIEIDDTPMKLVMNNSRISNDLLDSTFTENNSICFDEVSPLKEVEYSVGLLSPDNETKSRSNESHLDDVEFIEMDKDCLSVDQEYSW